MLHPVYASSSGQLVNLLLGHLQNRHRFTHRQDFIRHVRVLVPHLVLVIIVSHACSGLAKKSALRRRAWMPENISGGPVARSVFTCHPPYRTSGPDLFPGKLSSSHYP
jgi:hypothetical protein